MTYILGKEQCIMDTNMSLDRLSTLITAVGDDERKMRVITDSLDTFQSYHNAISTMETWLKTGPYSVEKRMELDGRRSNCHNAVLVRVNMLNRLAEQLGIPPLYEGTISEEKPYRREVANAVLALVAEIIERRL